MSLPEIQTEYPLVTSSWRGEGVIEVYDVTEQRLATFSQEFLRLGHVLNWAYIHNACQSVVQESGTLQTGASVAGNTSPPSMQPLDLKSSPTAGRYWYIRTDQPDAPCTWAPGPRCAVQEPFDDDESSSSYSNPQESHFKLCLINRDSRCIVTDDPEWESAVGAHILPTNQSEDYRRALGHQPPDYLHVSYGILLDRGWHHAFDNGDWSLYPCPNSTDLIIHVFQGRDQGRKVYHGKRLPRSRFRVWDVPDELPDVGLLQYHYTQCSIKNIRGFTA